MCFYGTLSLAKVLYRTPSQENKRNDAGDSRPDINENKITLPF